MVLMRTQEHKVNEFCCEKLKHELHNYLDDNGDIDFLLLAEDAAEEFLINNQPSLPEWLLETCPNNCINYMEG